MTSVDNALIYFINLYLGTYRNQLKITQQYLQMLLKIENHHGSAVNKDEFEVKAQKKTKDQKKRACGRCVCVCLCAEVGGGGRIVQLLVGGWVTNTVVQGSQGGGQGHHRVRVKATFRMVFRLSGGFPKSVSGVNLIISII